MKHATDERRVAGCDRYRHAAVRGRDRGKGRQRWRRHFVDDDERERFGRGAGVGARVGIAVEDGGVEALNKQLPIVSRIVALHAYCVADVEDGREGKLLPRALEVVEAERAEELKRVQSAV